MMATYLALIASGSDLPEGFDPTVKADSLADATIKFEAYCDRLGVKFAVVGSFVVKDDESGAE